MKTIVSLLFALAAAGPALAADLGPVPDLFPKEKKEVAYFGSAYDSAAAALPKANGRTGAVLTQGSAASASIYSKPVTPANGLTLLAGSTTLRLHFSLGATPFFTATDTGDAICISNVSMARAASGQGIIVTRANQYTSADRKGRSETFYAAVFRGECALNVVEDKE